MTPSQSVDTTRTDEPVRQRRLDVASTGRGRLYRGQTAIDFVGKSKYALIVSLIVVIATVVSLFTRGLNLGIDFEGGVAWDIPSAELSIADVEQVLGDNDLDPASARIQERSSESLDFIKVQVGDQPAEVRDRLQTAFAEAAGVEVADVSTNAVSASWGDDITAKAVRALLFFTLGVAVFISLRYEWRMALAAIAAMLHDVVVTVGLYSLLGLLVTPATVIAFLTILGYSLYDTIIIFDRAREAEARLAGHKAPYADVVNVTLNQVLMRTLNTSISSVTPVLSILVVGSWIMGATALSEFALALFLGMAVGAYSSFYVAAPLLAFLKRRERAWRVNTSERASGDALRELVMGASPSARRTRAATTGATSDPGSSSTATPERRTVVETSPEALLTHAPRPRKKKRR